MYKEKYMQVLNGFQFNSLRPATKLNAIQLAHNLGLAPGYIARLQRTHFESAVPYGKNTQAKLIKLIEAHNLIFPDAKTIGVDHAQLNSCDKNLSVFQYRIGIYHLYDSNISAKPSSLSFLDAYFRTLDNWEILEKHTNLSKLVQHLKEMMEDRGIEFIGSNIVKYHGNLRNQKVPKEEIQSIFKEHLGSLILLEVRDLIVLKQLLSINQSLEAGERSFKVDYTQLALSLGIYITTLRRCIVRLRDTKLLIREKREMGEVGLENYIKLNLEKISEVQNKINFRQITT